MGYLVLKKAVREFLTYITSTDYYREDMKLQKMVDALIEIAWK